MKEKVDYLKKEFYNNPHLLVNIFNKLLEGGYTSEIDMYTKGGFLFLEVYDNENTRGILSPAIKDFDTYKEENNKGFSESKDDRIGMCLLYNLHEGYYPYKDEIFYSKEHNVFHLIED